MKNLPKLVVFSDLDGTLLDHETYRWDAARPALARLAEMRLPIVLASSKTAAEMSVYQREMGLSAFPAIVENGAGIIGLTDETATETYDTLRDALDALPRILRQGFRGFGDMSPDEVSRITGLSPDAAERAMARGYSEPGIWSGDSDLLDRFTTKLVESGISAQRGGRFLTLSFGRTKADAMDVVMQALGTDHSLALGDAPNDVDMLRKATHGVIIANPNHTDLPVISGESEGRITRTKEVGPSGWNTAVNTYLDMLIQTEGQRLNG